MKRSLIFSLVALSLLNSCQPRTEVPCIDDESPEFEVELTIGKYQYVPRLGAILLFDTIVQDSRCPVNTYCVWEGEVEVRIIIDPGKHQTNVNLKNSDNGKVVYIQDYRYHFKLIDVDPHPEEMITQKLHTAKLQVQRICNQDRCKLDPDPGPCFASFIRYYYDQEEKKCKSFIYGGCDGIVPFETLEECKACESSPHD